MNEPLELRKVTKYFMDGEQKAEILKELDFKVNRGEFVAIVGPSGSGKSTMLSIAGALLTPDGGEVIVNGRSLGGLSDSEKAKVRLTSIGYIFQASNLVPFLKVKDQLKLVAELAGSWDDSARKRADELLEAMGMSQRQNRRIQHLSGGEKQRVAIARAFMNEPDLILADEPTAALDASRSNEIIALIKREAHSRNKAAVLVTHDESVLHHCDNVYEVSQGKLRLR
ncbi:hemin ABC transporter ATP-binding protein [Paenibacillus oryzae]|uniref:Hemin ABC transporter ATP-binding protein n=1 Tax=Paenibacillus oryzae TaxID=1844972 RepID=A0A1A5YIQ1_9BACL|nr:ABC transporter ATP-binding protein [Paenibacillus oryzae]OBR65486.1 hemin ABC transporter ATP-binding protein [Paenibacillus oryzae]